MSVRIRMKFIFLVMILTSFAFNSNAFDAENCPGECHCTMDGLLMLADCSGLGLSELPEFPDNQVRIKCNVLTFLCVINPSDSF